MTIPEVPASSAEDPGLAEPWETVRVAAVTAGESPRMRNAQIMNADRILMATSRIESRSVNLFLCGAILDSP
jgi:hypothetical protein